MTTQRDPRIIDASPTKDFFIEMLAKDIELTRSIIDLVDNCVDGARRIRDADYTGLSVRLQANAEYFKIADNCGGIPVDLARDYAFRFGRPEDMPQTLHSVGQFGVGMKRALFKLGKKFEIQSTTGTSRFVIEEDVDEWRGKKEWEFRFRDLEELSGVAEEEQGTLITVTSLHESVSSDFALDNFQTRLRDEIKDAHAESMDKGLAITHNGIPLDVRPFELLHSDDLRPAYREITFGDRRDTPVTVKIYAGVSESDPTSAGWYIFCNGRLVLGANQSATTGWGEGRGKTIPKYHNQFARFRGFAFFDSDNAGRLPWNTTKTGVDTDSPIYRSVRLEMITLMRPVIDFLNRLDSEKDLEERDPKPLEASVRAAAAGRLADVPTHDRFIAPEVPRRPTPPRTGNILYQKPLDKINRAKKVLKASSFRAVGEKTFDYFFERECED